ncbi:MAG: ChaN family lipoprotein [Moritella sp.]|uniref:ChaN family lipoprotein n=1 Tax=Moritella sp. TaxID=78556 RepID=UPI0029B51039|nr:ChaN family lipoprotein [Moritella sp.]MDX2319629.1 ChaN family lipoprotein [Moritella sp.]
MFNYPQALFTSTKLLRRYKRNGMRIALAGLLSGCAASPSLDIADKASYKQEVTTYFDYNLQSSSGQDISLSRFVEEIKDADVVLVGEWHTHTGIHRFQTELLQAMLAAGDDVALSMEQFTRDKQTVVDAYLAGEIGEGTLITRANAWPNYSSDYRPLVELAKTNNIDIIAANAPKHIIRCIGTEGMNYVAQLPAEQRTWLAANINTQDSAYKTHFMASMHHGDESQNENKFAAQVTWDETMAESIVNYLADHSNSLLAGNSNTPLTDEPSNVFVGGRHKQVLHIAGKFHTENGLGTAASILARAPELKVVIVTPVDVTSTLTTADKTSNDYRLQVLVPPKQFVISSNMMASFKHLSKRNDELKCIE